MQEVATTPESASHASSHDMALEELCRAHFEIVHTIDELTEQKDALKRQILAAMPTKTATTSRYKVTKIQQLLVKTSIEYARSHGYTVMQEQADKEKLRKLYSEGISIPDIEQIEYVRITEKT